MLKNIKLINFNHLKLASKLTLVLFCVFIGGMLLSGTALSSLLNYRTENEITSKALMLIQTMSSVRNYTSNQVKPELLDKLETKFLPESVPAYSAREVFENFRADPTYNNFFYKEATLNPTNLRDKADAFETEIIQRFRQSRDLKELKGFRSSKNGNIFYIARPLRISKDSCLQCHSVANRAPKSMIKLYGATNGFGWKLNEIVGAQIISVPASKVFQSARESFIVTMGIVLGVFALATFIVNFWLKHAVVQPLTRMAQVAEVISKGDLKAEFQKLSNDEVGQLAEAFTRMKTSFALAMRRLKKQQN
ncbi:Tll0287-like domain-containing protein [Calothrix rhizosoleniae]|uniref:Tll0287-like domain-containing protein n=1 Tax=Calothrix rhizosoleniae TaxID=888997 RepID=UPI000B4A0ECD|nr:DUF3365 domain-containing protein [Calothrix rhizosoleniae]